MSALLSLANASPLKLAYLAARDLMAAREGAGFRFIVTLNSGRIFDVIPLETDSLTYPKDGMRYWPCLHGENVLILRHAAIASIEVYEC